MEASDRFGYNPAILHSEASARRQRHLGFANGSFRVAYSSDAMS